MRWQRIQEWPKNSMEHSFQLGLDHCLMSVAVLFFYPVRRYYVVEGNSQCHPVGSHLQYKNHRSRLDYI